MSLFRFERYTLGVLAAAAMLAGCEGGSGTPLRPSPAGLAAERTRPSVAYRVLYSFGHGSGDGIYPYAGLVNVKGTLCGTTINGGANEVGTAFAITKSGTETVLYSFGKGSDDGEFPEASLLNVTGKLYGTTHKGGDLDDGTVFAITKSGTEIVLHSFGGHYAGDGAYPYAGLVNVKGTLYGTTYGGGADCNASGVCGTVFSITPSGKETVLHSFPSRSGDGIYPYAGLINVKGTLYGTTSGGGAHGYGTVFSITPSGKEKVIHSFAGGSEDGAHPAAGLINVNGTLYGTTSGGGSGGTYDGDGTVFAITRSGTETVLYSFKSGSGDGKYPDAGVINVKGTLYGTTVGGGVNTCGYLLGCGTVFATTTSGKETVLHSFGGSGDGIYPYAGLVNVKGTLYGTTWEGGANGYGTVFLLSP